MDKNDHKVMRDWSCSWAEQISQCMKENREQMSQRNTGNENKQCGAGVEAGARF